MNIENPTILITGGTGSFGKALVHRLRDTTYKEIRIFSRDELKQEHMRIENKNPKMKFFIGDVRDPNSIEAAMRGVDLVFHAAALKQVPSCEFFPIQAVMTNILGSQNVIQAAMRHGVKKLVCLSTDKAAYPINAMGMSKAMMEKVAMANARVESDTTVCCVRYGNVMYSRGSVIPLFVKQIRDGQPITVTVPDMTRFLLPLRNAVDLVLFAFDHANPGDLFVQKAPACRIDTLAHALKKIFNAENPVQTIGFRHGEKLYETLLTREEFVKAEDMGNYYRVSNDERDLNYSLYFTEGEGEATVLEDYHSHNAEQLDVDQVAELLLSLPEIQRDLEENGE